MDSKKDEILNIAIDGPAGSGKSTAAKNLAATLGIEYIDTGAMYRAVAYKTLKSGFEPDDEESVNNMLMSTEIDFIKGRIYLDGEDVSDKIRDLKISQAASSVSQLPACRTKLTELQRNIAAHKSVVMDGRDIGTNVLPDADYKFFITASAKKRAERRYAELKDQGKDVTLEGVLADINKRDIKDTSRALNPLKKAEDAVEISTDDMDIEQTLKALMKIL